VSAELVNGLTGRGAERGRAWRSYMRGSPGLAFMSSVGVMSGPGPVPWPGS
jgi:hypothetical protein